MPALFSNNASATLASSITTSATSITVSTGMGSLFPTVSGGNFFYATLTDSSNNLEIVKVTGRASDVLTVVRAQEGTTARTYAASDKIELRITAAVMSNLAQLDGAQTFTGVKTFSAGLVGALTGNVTGNVTGAVTGNVTGNVTGDLTGNVIGTVSNATNAANLIATNFSISESGGLLTFIAHPSFTASIAGTTMTVTSASANYVVYGATLTGTGVTSGTTVGVQLTSTETATASPTYSSGGAIGSTYFVVSSTSNVSVGQMIDGVGIPNGTYVGSVNSGSIALVDRTGAAVAFTVQASGTYNVRLAAAKGTYTVSTSQTVASTAITGTKTVASLNCAGTLTAFTVTAGTP